MNIYISEKLLWTILWSSAQQVEDGKLIIVQEGSIQKFKKKLLGWLGSQGILLQKLFLAKSSLADVLDMWKFLEPVTVSRRSGYTFKVFRSFKESIDDG